MSDAASALEKLLGEDKRFKKPAYIFVFDSLSYAHSELGMGGDSSETSSEDSAERHLTGQQLCEGIRQYALDQYGYMAKVVLNSWGVQTTGDFGEIVFNLIRIGLMRKTPSDRREDFDDVFDFEDGLQQSFQITPPAE